MALFKIVIKYLIDKFISRFGVAVQYVSNFFQRILIANLMDWKITVKCSKP